MRSPILSLAAIFGSGAACGSTPAAQIPDAGPPDAGLPDAWAVCPSDAGPRCDYFLGCDCDPTDKCSAGASGPTCFTAGASAAGADCASETDCASGTTCAPYFGSSICLQFCDVSHRCPAGEACYINVDDQESPAHVIGHTCGQACSLLAQNCAFVGQGCYYNPSIALPAEDGECTTAGTGFDNDPCVFANDCAAGWICVNRAGSSDSFCAKLCDRTGIDPKCDVGACQQLMGETETGICLTN